MARTDIAGLLTGMPSSRPDPMGAGINSEQQRLAFGAQRAEGLQRGMRGLMGGDTMTPAEQLQMAMAQLDLSKPEDLRKLASVQQATGDLAGAAQTAARIQAMATAKTQEDRAERGLVVREEQLAMQKTAAGEAKDREDALLAQQGVSRALFAKQARDNGNENLALLIEKGAITLEKASSLLFGTSNAVIKAPNADEEKAFDRILGSEKFQNKIEDLEEREFTNWFWFVKDISDETKQAIYFKAKELMARQRLSAEEALEKAVTSVKLLDQIPEGSDTDKKERRKVDSRGRPLPDETPSPQADDAYTDMGK
jgi:hypothetical protein